MQTELKLLYTNDTIRLLTQLRHKYYEHGEKTGSLLARQIKEVAASRLITEIRTSAGQITTDPKRINDVFREYYKALYSSDSKKIQT